METINNPIKEEAVNQGLTNELPAEELYKGDDEYYNNYYVPNDRHIYEYWDWYDSLSSFRRSLEDIRRWLKSRPLLYKVWRPIKFWFKEHILREDINADLPF